MRICLGCREAKPKKQLIRVVKNKENEISIDLTGKKSGRGAYICKDISCFERIKKTGGLERAFETPVCKKIYEQLGKELEGCND